ncbi:MAG: hypothetical protein IKF17_04960 [Clostridia bacterium]|nr:hypothetical protein [Clostridia bacterium]
MRENQFIYKNKQLLILIIILLFIVSFVVVLARYVTNNVSDFFLRSKEFYFYSDKLEANTAVYQIDNWSGVDDYSIIINMNSRLNNLKATSYDIGYNITYNCTTDNAICQLSKQSGTIYSNTNTDFFTLTITPNTQLDTGDKVTVEIEATSTTEYTKKLKGRFTLVVGKENVTYEITDAANNPYMDLRITNTLSYYTVREQFVVDDTTYQVNKKIDIDTYLSLSPENQEKCSSAIVTIGFDPNVVLIDMTNEIYREATNIHTTTIAGKTYINEFTVTVDAISSKSLRFYKVDTTHNYSYPNSSNSMVLTINSI